MFLMEKESKQKQNAETRSLVFKLLLLSGGDPGT